MSKTKCPYCNQPAIISADADKQFCQSCGKAIIENGKLINDSSIDREEVIFNLDQPHQPDSGHDSNLTKTDVELPVASISSARKPVQKIELEAPKRSTEDLAGWLVVHDENKEESTFDLYVGDNYFGNEGEGYEVDILIPNDVFVSRSHANIQISKDFLNRFQAQLLDDGSRRPQGPSLNGTFVNGNEERLPKETHIFLRDGDTIQVGETKLVFKSIEKFHTVQEAAVEVRASDYTATIALNKTVK